MEEIEGEQISDEEAIDDHEEQDLGVEQLFGGKLNEVDANEEMR